MKNLLTRIATAVILAPLVIYVILIGGNPLVATMIVAGLIMYGEWCRITYTSKYRIIWWMGGFYYIAIPVLVIILASEMAGMRMPFMNMREAPIILLTMFLVVWMTDIGGYVFGRIVGGPKIAPKISPNKTWAGLLGGIIFSLVFFLLQNLFEPFKSLYENDYIFHIALVVYTVGPIIAQIGDFFESWVKRRFGKKDSGVLIPGHGGLLDRLDGLLSICHVIAIVVAIRIIIVQG